MVMIVVWKILIVAITSATIATLLQATYATAAASSQNGPSRSGLPPPVLDPRQGTGDPRQQQQQQQQQQRRNQQQQQQKNFPSSPILQDVSNIPMNDEEDNYGMMPPPPQQWEQQQQQQQQGQQRPYQHPLQRSLASSSNRLPIHYQFRNKRELTPPSAANYPSGSDTDIDFIPPLTAASTEDPDDAIFEVDDMDDGSGGGPSYASPRNDAVARYLSSTPMARQKLSLSAGLIGAALGAFVGKSLFSSPAFVKRCIFFWCMLFLIGTAFRNPYGELVRALGLALIYTVQETKTIRQRYPVGWQRLQLAISVFSSNPNERRQPFPKRPEEFSRVYALLAMALIGSICGSNIPLLPSWLGAMMGGIGLAFSTTLPDARGDLARIMAMRVVALTTELWQIQQELEIVPKVGVVSGLILDKIMILDRQHRIKEKVGSILTLVYTQIARVIQQSQQQGRTDNDGNDTTAPNDSFAFGDRNRRRDTGGAGAGAGAGVPPPLQQDDWRRPYPPRNNGGGGRDDRDVRRPEWERPPLVDEQQPQLQRGRSQPPPPPPQQQRGSRGRF